uniref:Mitochondrial carrier protein n=1 Tax=Grammatophora oceanica TaxID=210454 RepID=A0A7S1VGQ1_9STRA|mmetsp:Transcript_4606/g.6391  ORF Transcript_4606/g.6391 Transcript_4606/m.6391 type:complete len:314 (+) Transcript_4606:96-1037(+)|eukprot:CAMPEP_0194032656 /NCGR_PEP_ID=MMETSP0009_2-20130614/5548_1 /TAXON_ID=210454 /ORGANISM="Grammatophora oceanica, Strain CCMP 410" /LENGTH=313 /DNA_ID=CAMNT_0038673165 /DNA_START=42 /DNA_END=983 /DNA_ORIENTATION=+
MVGSSEHESIRNSPVLHNALGSASAGIIARLFTHPLDTAKARLMNQSSSFRGPADVFRTTLATEGFRGLYRGFGTVLIGGTPGTMLYLCSYDFIKQSAQNNEEFYVHFSAGMLAEAIACVVYVPVDVIKERLQVQSPASTKDGISYKNGWDALIKIQQTEGIRGIYRGYGATLASFGPFSALYFMFYEQLKMESTKRLDLDRQDLPFHWTVGCTCAAGAVASWLTSPLDMAKLRLQVQRAAQHNLTTSNTTADLTYNGMIQCLQSAYKIGGVKELFRGAGARVLHFAPATTITMTCFETFRTFFARSLSSTER